MAVDRKNTITILHSGTNDTNPPSSATGGALSLSAGELCWQDQGNDGTNGKLWIGDSNDGSEFHIGGCGTGAVAAAAAAGSLTGSTLNSTVTGSSLTSLGTIASLVATTADINAGTIDNATIGATTASSGAFTTLACADITSTGDDHSFTNATASKPAISITNTADDATGPILKFASDNRTTAAAGDDAGTIQFFADNSTNEQIQYAAIKAEIGTGGHTNTDEAGKLSFFVSESDGSTAALTAGLILEGQPTDDGEIDVTIGAGSASTTTIAGDLAVTGTPPTWNQNTSGTAANLSGTPNISVGTVTGTNGTFSGDVAITGDLTVSGGTTELSSTVIAATDKELLLSVTTGIMTAAVTRSSTTLTLTMESAHGLSDNGSTGYEVPITGSANQTALPDGVYKVVYSSGTVLTATSPVSGTISSSFAASVGLGVVTDTTATGAGIVVPRTVALGNASFTYEGASAGWSPTGNFTFQDGAFDVDIASHDTSNGLKLGGTLVTATAAELNYVDGVTSGIQAQLDAKGTSNLAIGTTGSTAMAGNVLSAQDKTDISNLSGTNTGDQTLTGLNYIVDNAADTMTVSDFGAAAALTIDADQPATAGAEDSTGLHVDYDRAVAGSGTAAHNDIGIDLDVNTASLGASSAIGLDMDVVGATSGTHTSTGLDITVSGSDTNNGIVINTPDGATGTGMKVVSSADTADYFSIDVGTHGETTLTTVDDGAAIAHLNFSVDGGFVVSSSGIDISAAGAITNATLAGGTF